MKNLLDVLLAIAVFSSVLVATQEIYKDVVINDLRGFDDSILFDIDWQENKIFNPKVEDEYLVNDAVLQHEYSCAIPRLETKEAESTAKEYTGRGPLDLIADLITTAACSFRAESYWTYEVCHGDYIKQYHEEREGKSVKVQEYLLGRWNKKRTEELRERLADAERRNEPVQYKKIEGLTLPYLELDMTDGTPCGLIENKPRQARVLYVCYPHGKNEVYSLKEVSTCQYEVIILTQALCEHPSYKPLAAAENRIRCSPTEAGAPVPPKSAWPMPALMLNGVLKMETDMEQFSRILADLGAAIKNHPNSAAQAAAAFAAGSADIGAINVVNPSVPTAPALAGGSTPFTDFITGVSCLTGGHGWWKYEFCYGKYVRQYHRHKNGEQTSLMLGKFDRYSHRAWLLAHRDRRYTPDASSKDGGAASAKRATLSHFYDQGTVCELTGRARQTEVKLKCMESASSPHQVSLYLLEPKTCEYVLNVESPLVCELFESVDEDGLIPIIPVLGAEKPKVNFGV